MANDFRDVNPYATPTASGGDLAEPRRRLQGRVIAPAIALMVVSTVGLGLSVFNVGWAFMKHEIDPQAPELVRRIQEGAVGPLAAFIQGGFAVLNGMILLGGAQMFRFRTWGMAVAAAIMAMVNFGSCCCLVGAPVGIWALVILLMPEVKAAFE